ncbi:DUF4239 domain-containing protein [Edaphobacter sp.]|uniref:bestrophin-like domain n=1 Tax=Edaphobacter sp. TaxID=1934404 RepID=UPI002DB7C09D|nr:DUF4239 domain-containing protein [Edaphobacter sp.]HEU5341515.1 DUF4239 domain-containing protein [Edaphobacter sp.]
MLGVLADVLLILVTVACSLATMVLLNRFWPYEKRKAHNDLIGWHLGVLGTTYAVILGFMLYTVWTNFGAASVNSEAEANALVNIHRLARGLPDVQRAQMRELAVEYADSVIERGWPAMARGQINPESNQISRKMWQTLMSIQSPSWTEITAEDHALYELSTLTEHRQVRQLEVTSRLPSVLWCVLLIGGVLTIFSACLFGQENALIHGIQVFSFAFLIALVLVAIADIDRPFQGSVHVDDSAFTRAQINMQGEP